MTTLTTLNARDRQSAPSLRRFVASSLRRFVASALRPITKVRKWGVSKFGMLRTFDFQPKNAGRTLKVSKTNNKNLHTLVTLIPLLEKQSARPNDVPMAKQTTSRPQAAITTQDAA